MKTQKYNFLFLLIGIILFGTISCTPEKRLARILKNNPALIKTDTTWKQDSVTIAGASKDSTFSFYQHDTVTLKQNNMTVKYFFNHDSTVFLQGKCDPIVKKYFYPVIHTIASIPARLTSRNSFADYAKKKGLDIHTIKYLLGHSKTSTTEKYMASFYEEETDNAMDTLFG